MKKRKGSEEKQKDCLRRREDDEGEGKREREVIVFRDKKG